MESEVEEIDAPAGGSGAIDWENRRLCSDGNCIGVIGADGRCKECGRPHEPTAGLSVERPAAPAPASDAPAAPAPAAEAAADPSSGDWERPGDDWENRRLCSDGNCIGVIGADGRCRECGKPYEG
jgi:hypothetical protein